MKTVRLRLVANAAAVAARAIALTANAAKREK